jgi:lipoate-protein ligase B
VGQWSWLGRLPFAETAEFQERLRRAVLAGAASDTLLVLEHDPVITLGRAADPAHVLASTDQLERDGIAVVRATRGGDVTYHGPGQLVAYPVVRLRAGVRAHVRAMAAAVIDLLGEWGIEGHYRDDAPGVWVTRDGRPAKIAAFGINVHHRIAVHGLAFNLCPRLDHFARIVPCGLSGVPVTSVAELLSDRGVSASPSASASASTSASASGATSISTSTPASATTSAFTSTTVAGSVADDWPTPVGSAARLARALGERLGIAFQRKTDPTELLCKATSLE